MALTAETVSRVVWIMVNDDAWLQTGSFESIVLRLMEEGIGFSNARLAALSDMLCDLDDTTATLVRYTSLLPTDPIIVRLWDALSQVSNVDDHSNAAHNNADRLIDNLGVDHPPRVQFIDPRPREERREELRAALGRPSDMALRRAEEGRYPPSQGPSRTRSLVRRLSRRGRPYSPVHVPAQSTSNANDTNSRNRSYRGRSGREYPDPSSSTANLVADDNNMPIDPVLLLQTPMPGRATSTLNGVMDRINALVTRARPANVGRDRYERLGGNDNRGGSNNGAGSRATPERRSPQFDEADYRN